MAGAGRRVVGLARRLAGRGADRTGSSFTTAPPPPAPPPFPPPPVRVDTDVGSLLLPAHDQLILPVLLAEGRWEPDEADVLRALLRPGMNVVDVGAHVGYMTLLAAAAVGPGGRVWAVEPAPGNAALLRANLEHNGVANVEVIEAAASDRAGRIGLSLSPWNSGDNRAYPVPAMEQVDVAAVRLDDVLPPEVLVDVVKVDTQGTDHRAVRGMAILLARSRPVLVVEFWPPAIVEQGEDPAGVVAGYAAMGFEVRVLGDGGDGGPPPAPADVVAAAEAHPAGYLNLLLRPAGRG
ncbi:MAG: FkbM family methyltransferase [Acidimicrobiales bacterium]